MRHKFIALLQSHIFLFLLMGLYAVIISYPFRPEAMAVGHDFSFHLNRINYMAQELPNQFPVRIYGEQCFGLGTPTGIYYPSLFLYIPAFLHFLGLSDVAAYGILGLLLNITTIYVNYWAFSRLFESHGTGVVAALFYEFFLYRLIDFYSRSALGEMIAMTFFPAACISIWLWLSRGGKYWVQTVIFCTFILQSHIISGIYLFGVALVLVVWQREKILSRPNRSGFLKVLLFLVLLNAWVYVPIIWCIKHIHATMQDLWLPLQATTFVSSSWLFDLQGFMGWGAFFMLSISLVGVIWQRKNIPMSELKLFFGMFLLGIFFTCATLDFFPWHKVQHIPYIGYRLSFMQFPYRLTTFTAVAFTICVCVGLNCYARKISKYVFCSVVALLFLVMTVSNFNSLYTMSGKFYGDGDFDLVQFNASLQIRDLTDKEVYKNTFPLDGNILDYVYSDLVAEPSQLITENGRIRYVSLAAYLNARDKALGKFSQQQQNYTMPPYITNFSRQGTHAEFDSNLTAAAPFNLPMLYYPGYAAYLSDGQKVDVTEAPGHNLQINLPPGANHVTLKYEGLRLFRIMDMVSFVSLAVFVFLIIRDRRKNQCHIK